MVAAQAGWDLEKKTRHAAEPDRPDGAEPRAHWHERLAVDSPARLVCVDESGANTQRSRWCGRFLGGQRLVAPLRQGHDQSSTLIAAIRVKGPCAPGLVEGAMKGELFLAWVRQGWVAALQKHDLLIMDNLATHQSAGVGQAIETGGSAPVSAALLAGFQPPRNHAEQDQANPAPRRSPDPEPTHASRTHRLQCHFNRRLSRLLFTRPLRYMI